MLFTVFTSTYNRRHLLHRVVTSLESQVLRDFEWIVVDDGSSDGTSEWIEGLVSSAPFSIRLFRAPENGGKHMAWNLAVREARGDFFVIADSDDGFTADALQRMAEIWTSIPIASRPRFSGVTVLCKDSTSGAIVGESYPSSPYDSNALELHFVSKIRGEKWGCVRTELLRQIPFPISAGSHFAENYVWYSLARRFQLRCVNEPLRIFFDDIRTDRLTQERRVSIPASRFHAGYLWNAIHLNENLDYLRTAPKELITTVTNLARSGRILQRPVFETTASLRTLALRLLFWALYPLALLLYHRDRMQGRFDLGK